MAGVLSMPPSESLTRKVVAARFQRAGKGAWARWKRAPTTFWCGGTFSTCRKKSKGTLETCPHNLLGRTLKDGGGDEVGQRGRKRADPGLARVCSRRVSWISNPCT